MNDENTDLTITLFRHGQSGYEQGNGHCKVEEARDLCAKPITPNEPRKDRVTRAINEVRANAEKFVLGIPEDASVRIISSPTGRTLHTASIIGQVVGFQHKDVRISTHSELSEVGGFTWDKFRPLMEGGTVIYHENGTIRGSEANKALTNPKNLGYPEYFIEDAAHHLSPTARASLPANYLKIVDGFENFRQVTRRVLSLIQHFTQTWKNGNIVLVTHDCSSMYLADRFTGGRQKGLVPGTFLSMKRCDNGRLVVTRVGDITDGDCETDFVQAFLSAP